jgi:hypothetical protein
METPNYLRITLCSLYNIPDDVIEKLKYINNETEIIIEYKDTKNFLSRYLLDKFSKKTNKLPDNIKRIYFTYNYNDFIDYLPNNLTHLRLWFSFNETVNNLPLSITHLSFLDLFDRRGYHGDYYSIFNKSVDNLPLSLTHLTFGRQTPVRLAHPKIFIIFEMSFF